MNAQLEDADDKQLKTNSGELNRQYDAFSAKFGLINDRANRLAFSDDSSYYLLSSLEVLDEDRNSNAKRICSPSVPFGDRKPLRIRTPRQKHWQYP